MALSDINFQEGEGQFVLLELPVGTLNSPVDILIGSASVADTYPVTEIDGSSNIFIMSE